MITRTPPVCPVPRTARAWWFAPAPLLLAAAVAALPGCLGDGDPMVPRLSYSPSELSMEEVVLGHPAVGTVEIWNDGEAILEIEAIVLEGEGYSFASPLLDQGGLGPGEGSWIEVTYDPDEDGPSIGAMTVKSNDPEAPTRKVAIQAVGISSGVVASPSAVYFERGSVDDVQLETVVLQSVGEAPLTVLGIGIVGDGEVFTIEMMDVVPGPGTMLDPAEEVEVTVRFQPRPVQYSLGTLRVITDDPQTPVLDIDLDGPPASSDPLCGITLGPESTVPEFTKIDLSAWAAVGEGPGTQLWFDWWDDSLFPPYAVELMASGYVEPSGLISESHVVSGVGQHRLDLWIYDDWGGYCQKQTAYVVVENHPPTAQIVQPNAVPAYTLPQGECLEFWGVVADNEDGWELPLTWTSDHPQAPVPLDQGTGDPDNSGFHTYVACDLPCGEQIITLETLDSATQTGSDSTAVDITVREPTLDPIPDQQVVLGQRVEIPLQAVPSCGTPPLFTISGAPPTATINGVTLEYEPVFAPGDNPVGQVFQIDVHAEITHGNHTAFDDISFQLTVVSDEFIALSGAQPDELLLSFNQYDGSWTDEQALALPHAAEPRAVSDLDGDGADDLLLADALGGALVMLRGAGGAFLDVPLPWSIDGPVATGDVDGDGRLDVVVLDPLLGATTYLNATPLQAPLDFDPVPAALDLASVAPGPDPVLAATLLDHDGDGRDDLAVAFADDVGSPVYLALASAADPGRFEAPQPVLQAPPTWGLAQGLLDPDGIPDLLTGGAGVGDPGQAYLHAGDGGSGFGAPVEAFDVRPLVEEPDLLNGGIAGGASRYLPTDVDHDGCTDLIVVFVSYLDPTGQNTVLSVGTVLQQYDGISACMGLFGDGSGEDAPDVILVTTAPAEVVASHGG